LLGHLGIFDALRAGQAQNARVAGRTIARAEVVGYRRSAALPGVEVLDAQRSPRQWRVVCPDFSVVMFRTWRGDVLHRGRMHQGEPGVVFCCSPDEAMVADPHGPGSFSVLKIEPQILAECRAEQQPSSARLDWAGVMRPISAQLRAQFHDFFEIFEPEASALQVQSKLLELSELMIGELMQNAQTPRAVTGPPPRAATRMRECLNEEGLSVDLETLAKQAGLSRFQALRAFKQRYGLPPHTYQLCLRIAQAQSLLRQGAAAADVAHRCGFADQSHFTRHFKRQSGVTPMQYARAAVPASESKSGTFRVAGDPEKLIARSDR
jgi:AraC-like DNA-binding protein